MKKIQTRREEYQVAGKTEDARSRECRYRSIPFESSSSERRILPRDVVGTSADKIVFSKLVPTIGTQVVTPQKNQMAAGCLRRERFNESEPTGAEMRSAWRTMMAGI